MKPTLSTYGGLLADVAYKGMLVDQNNFFSESKTNEGVVAIDFGQFVVRGVTQDESCIAPSADNQEIIGISMRHPVMQPDQNGNFLFQQYRSVPVLYGGYIWLLAAENVTRGDDVLSLTANATYGPGAAGGLTGGAAAAGRVKPPFYCRWETTTAAGALGKVRVNR